jgi:hypothetical protein
MKDRVETLRAQFYADVQHGINVLTATFPQMGDECNKNQCTGSTRNDQRGKRLLSAPTESFSAADNHKRR